MLWTDNYSLGHNTPFLMMTVKNEANGHLAEPRLFSAYLTFLFPICIGNRMNASAFRDLWVRVMF